MILIYSGLFFLGHLLPPSFGMMAIDTGLGPLIASSEEAITDFASLADNGLLAKLPSQFTICSSFSTDAFTTRLFPFQLLHESGDPLITFQFYAPDKTSRRHRINFKVGNNH